MSRLASFHLARAGRGRSASAMAHLALDRRVLARTDGLVFWRLLGTGRGSDTGPSADLRRTAMFAVWESPDALQAFMRDSPMVDRWNDGEECWHVELAAAPGRSGHGRWRGFDPLDRLIVAEAVGPLAIITRADVRPGAWRGFRASGRLVAGEVSSTDGLIDVLGIGEAPFGRLGTFSLWRDAEAVRRFVSDMPHHRDAVRSTRSGRWYSEELFARFVPVASAGTWSGRDPLDGIERLH